MSIPDMRNWSDEDRTIATDFLSANPPLAAYPHLIFKASRSSLELTLGTVGVKGGLWGHAMPFNASQEWPVVQQFHRWEELRNQEYLLEAGWGILTATEFTMIIAANTEREVLAHMATSLEKQTTCDWQRHFEDLAHWIDYLGWAYVPLKHGEHDHAFFVTRKSDKQWIEALCERLDAAGYRSAKLHRHEGRTHWDGPLVL